MANRRMVPPTLDCGAIFRVLKQQALRLEDSQLATADGLLKLTAVAALAACTTLQLVQARDGQSAEHCSIAFTSAEIRTLENRHVAKAFEGVDFQRV